MKIKNIIFDACGVLYIRPKAYRRFKFKILPSKYGYKGTADEFKIAWKSHKKLAHTGKMSRAKWIKATLADLGLNISSSALKKFYDAGLLAAKESAKNNTKGSLPILKKKYKLYVLSDTVWPCSVKKDILKEKRILKYFDGIYCSSELGVTKHFPDCFKIVLRAEKMKVGETLFVGHKIHEITGAKLAGLTTVSLGTDVGADYRIETLKDLPQLVKEINKK